MCAIVCVFVCSLLRLQCVARRECPPLHPSAGYVCNPPASQPRILQAAASKHAASELAAGASDLRQLVAEVEGRGREADEKLAAAK